MRHKNGLSHFAVEKELTARSLGWVARFSHENVDHRLVHRIGGGMSNEAEWNNFVGFDENRCDGAAVDELALLHRWLTVTHRGLE